MKRSLLFVACTVFFTGCTVTAPSVELPSVDVQSPIRVVPSGDSYDGGKGCPPGLRKQGRC